MLGNSTNHAHNSVAPDDAALLTDAADGGADFHAAELKGGEVRSGEGEGAGVTLPVSRGVPGRNR